MHATCSFAGDTPGLLYWCIDMVDTRSFTLLQTCVGPHSGVVEALQNTP